MRYLAIDIETTGLDTERCEILEFAAVLDDTRLPFKEAVSFHSIIRPPEGCYWELGAIKMHQLMLPELENGIDKADLMDLVCSWLRGEKVTLAGFNIGKFDWHVLRRLKGFERFQHHHRMIEVGSLFVESGDECVPSTIDCCRRAGIGAIESHRAMADAWRVCELVRKKLIPKTGEQV